MSCYQVLHPHPNPSDQIFIEMRIENSKGQLETKAFLLVNPSNLLDTRETVGRNNIATLRLKPTER